MTEGIPSPESPPKPKRSLRERWLYSKPPTGKQITFDVVFGIIAPCLTLLFDPIVFRSNGCSIGPIIPFSILGYAMIGLGILTLIGWLVLGQRFRYIAGFVAGILLLGAVVALGVGIAIFPLSVRGLVFLLFGSLGFIPFVTAVVYLRNGLWAWQQGWAGNRLWFAATAIIGVVLVIGLPVLAQTHFTRQIDHWVTFATAPDADKAARAQAVAELRQVYFACMGLCGYPMQEAFYRIMVTVNRDHETVQELDQIYYEITGSRNAHYACATAYGNPPMIRLGVA